MLHDIYRDSESIYYVLIGSYPGYQRFITNRKGYAGNESAEVVSDTILDWIGVN